MVSSFAPGRVRLLGDHLEPLGLPVIVAAIDRGVRVEGEPNEQTRAFHIRLPDLADDDSFVPGPELPLRHQNDWLRAAVRLLCRDGWAPTSGWDVVVEGTLPAHVGLASGPAAAVAWSRFLLSAAGDERAHDNAWVARVAWQAVGAPAERRVPYYSCALGSALVFDGGRELQWKQLAHCPDTFVVGIALVDPAAAPSLLAWPPASQTREQVAEFVANATLREAKAAAAHLESASGRALTGIIMTRDLVAEGRTVFEQKNWPELGPLLSRQHAVLRDRLGQSTPKLEAMLEAAIRAGARGGKLLESHSIVVHAPRGAEKVMRAIEVVGGRASVVRVAEGTTPVVRPR